MEIDAEQQKIVEFHGSCKLNGGDEAHPAAEVEIAELGVDAAQVLDSFEEQQNCLQGSLVRKNKCLKPGAEPSVFAWTPPLKEATLKRAQRYRERSAKKLLMAAANSASLKRPEYSTQVQPKGLTVQRFHPSRRQVGVQKPTVSILIEKKVYSLWQEISDRCCLWQSSDTAAFLLQHFEKSTEAPLSCSNCRWPLSQLCNYQTNVDKIVKIEIVQECEVSMIQQQNYHQNVDPSLKIEPRHECDADQIWEKEKYVKKPSSEQEAEEDNIVKEIDQPAVCGVQNLGYQSIVASDFAKKTVQTQEEILKEIVSDDQAGPKSWMVVQLEGEVYKQWCQVKGRLSLQDHNKLAIFLLRVYEEQARPGCAHCEFPLSQLSTFCLQRQQSVDMEHRAGLKSFADIKPEPLSDDNLECPVDTKLDPLPEDNLECPVDIKPEPLPEDNLECPVDIKPEPLPEDNLECPVDIKPEPLSKDNLECPVDIKPEPLPEDNLECPVDIKPEPLSKDNLECPVDIKPEPLSEDSLEECNVYIKQEPLSEDNLDIKPEPLSEDNSQLVQLAIN